MDPKLDRQNVMLKFGFDSHGQHVPNSSQYNGHRRSTHLQDPFVLSSMHLNIDVRMRDLDTHGNINRENIHQCEDMIPYHATY